MKIIYMKLKYKKWEHSAVDRVPGLRTPASLIIYKYILDQLFIYKPMRATTPKIIPCPTIIVLLFRMISIAERSGVVIILEGEKRIE